PLNALREFKRRTKAQEAIRKMQSARGLAERLGGLRPGGGSPMRGSGMTVGLDLSARAAEETNRRPATPTPGSMPPPAESGTPTLRPPSPSEVRSSGRRSPMAPSAPTPVAFGSAP